MPPRRKLLHMALQTRTEAAKAEVIMLRDNICRSSEILVGADFLKVAKRLELLLKLLRYHRADTS